jgi:hypothetical protein
MALANARYAISLHSMKTPFAIALVLAAFALPAQAVPDLQADDPVGRASARVDAAEHALALARRNTWSTRDGVTLQPTRRTIADIQRIEFYRRDVLWARNSLVNLVQLRRAEEIAQAATEPESPRRIQVSKLEWVPYVPPR